MMVDIIGILGLLGSIILIYFQRKSIFELEKNLWEIEKAYRKDVGRPYLYKNRFFHYWGKNGGENEEQK